MLDVPLSDSRGARLPAEGPGVAPTAAEIAAAHLQLTGLRAGMDALDVGCGCGLVTRVMSTIVGSGRVTGLDGRAARVAAARAQAIAHGSDIEFLAGALPRLPVPPASFDYTWACGVVGARPDPAGALAELLRVTRPGGRVVVGERDGPLARRGGRGDRGIAHALYGWCAQVHLGDLRVQTLPYPRDPDAEPPDQGDDCPLILVYGTIPDQSGPPARTTKRRIR